MGCGIMFPRDYEGEGLAKDPVFFVVFLREHGQHYVLAVQEDVVSMMADWRSRDRGGRIINRVHRR